MTPTITPFLWFDNNAQEAAHYYCEVFADSKMISDTPTMIIFELQGQRFNALNGGPYMKMNEATSWMVNVETQEEVDYFWDKLSGGNEGKCGWCTDKFGVTWQIIPKRFGELMQGPSEQRGAVQKAMFGMTKLIIVDLEKAAEEVIS
jgi:predicted 3-demethylubiquinone-9 3-methyltransferase (glyoxalase superfamily)